MDMWQQYSTTSAGQKAYWWQDTAHRRNAIHLAHPVLTQATAANKFNQSRITNYDSRINISRELHPFTSAPMN